MSLRKITSSTSIILLLFIITINSNAQTNFNFGFENFSHGQLFSSATTQGLTITFVAQDGNGPVQMVAGNSNLSPTLMEDDHISPFVINGGPATVSAGMVIGIPDQIEYNGTFVGFENKSSAKFTMTFSQPITFQGIDIYDSGSQVDLVLRNASGSTLSWINAVGGSGPPNYAERITANVANVTSIEVKTWGKSISVDRIIGTFTPTCNITANAGANQTICSGSNASLSATGSGGTSPYTYSWNNGLGNGINKTVSPTSTTTYTLTVTDANGCTDVSNVTVTVINNFTNGGTIVGNESNCTNFDPATITSSSSPSGGSGGSTQYNWQQKVGSGAWTTISGATSATYNPPAISATTQYRRLARRSPCSSWVYSNTITKSISGGPTANAGTDQTLCSSTTATLTATATGGASPYTYAWNNGLGSGATKTVSPTATTTYTVTVTDANGCTDIDAVVVNVVNNFTNGGSIGADEGNCGSFDPATITNVTAPNGGSGGTTQYNWQQKVGSGAWTTISGETNATYTPPTISQTTQYRRLARRSPCTTWQYSNIITKSVNSSPTANAGANQNITVGNNATLTATASGGQSPYTFAWNQGLGSGANKTVSPTSTTTYTVTVTDANGCTDIDNVTITVNSCTAVADAGSNQYLCNGSGTNLTITATATGGTSPYTYSWNNGLGNGATKTVSPTTTTIYTVTITDANGCTAIDETTILVTDNFTSGGTIGSDEGSCTAFDPAPITSFIDPVGGSGGNIAYRWQERTTGGWSNITGANGLTYDPPMITETTQYRRIARRTPCGWQYSNVITKTVNSIPAVNAGTDQTITTGGSAVINATGTGGQSPYTYSWSNGLGNGANKVVSPTSTTTYTVTITDANGCTNTDEVTITVIPCSVSVDAGNDEEVCNGSSITLSATPSGGDAPLIYNWNNGLGSGISHTVSPTATTTYTVTITDANGCTNTDNVVITVIDNFTNGGTIGSNEANCNSFNPALITETAAPTGGSGGTIEYFWQQSVISGSWTTIAGATAATYNPPTITETTQYRRRVRKNPCSVWRTSNVITKTIYEKPTAEAGADQSIYIGNSTTITATATGGTSPYTFAWNNGLGNGETKTVSPVTTTIYTVTVTDANGCTAIDFLTVTANNCTVTVNVGANQNVCNGNSATFTAVGTGGASPYTFAWDNGLGNGETQTVSPFATTTYTVTITDNNGCTSTDNIIIDVVDNFLDGGTIGSDETNCGSFDPAIMTTITPPTGGTGGSAIYRWQEKGLVGGWSNISGITTETYDPPVITETTQYRRISRLTPCTSWNYSNTITKTVSGGLTANAGTDKDICNGASTNITATATNGITPYTFNWNQGLGGGATQTVSPTTTTEYIVTVTDASGCMVSDTIVVSVVNTFTSAGTIGNDEADCQGFDPANIVSLTAPSGGNGGTTNYLWQYRLGTSGTFTMISGATGATYNPPPITETTQYKRLARRNTCTPWQNSNIITKAVNTPPTAHAGIDQSITVGGNATLTATASGGASPYTFAWDNGLGSGANKTVSPTNTTTYTVTVTDAKGCTATDEVVVNVGACTATVNAGTDQTVCENTNVTLTAIGSNGTAPYTYSWNNGLGNGATKSIMATATTIYIVTVTDANGCTNTDNVKITVRPTPNITNITKEDETCGNQNGSMTFIFDETVGESTIEFSLDGGLTYPYSANMMTGTLNTTAGVPDPFLCQSGLYQVINTTSYGLGQLFLFDVNTNTYLPIGGNAGININAIGYNTIDNFIYGIAVGTGTDVLGNTISPGNLLKIDADGEVFRIGHTGMGSSYSAMVYNNHLWIINSSNLHKINLTNANVEMTIVLSQSMGADFVIINDVFYSVTNNLRSFSLLGLNDGDNVTATVAYFTNPGPGGFGAAWVATNSLGQKEMYFSENSTGIIYRIDDYTTSTPTITAIATGTVTNGNDGASCPTAQAGIFVGQNSFSINNLFAGTYDVWARWGDDACPVDLPNVTIADLDGLAVNMSNDTLLCGSEPKVVNISATPTGGVAPYSFTWDNGLNNASTHSVSPNSTTTYAVTVTDNVGCLVNDQVTVIVSPVPLVTVSKTNPNCGANDGSITFTFPDNTGRTTIQFSLNGGLTYQNIVADNSGSVTYANQAPGIYELYTRWGNGDCPTYLGYVTLSNNQNLKAAVTAADYVCIGNSTILNAVAVNGVTPYNFTWLNGVGNTASVTVSPNVTTTYTVRLIDGNGCVTFETVKLFADPCGEVCNNGIDDDGDGLIDCDDYQCKPKIQGGIVSD